MTNSLQRHLIDNPQIENVYINDKNEWQFHKRAGYDKVLTRDEVLDMDISDETEEIADKPALQTRPGKVSKKAAKVADETDEPNIEEAN